jgi:hypothetical protein
MTQLPDENEIDKLIYSVPLIEDPSVLDRDDTLRLRLAQDVAYGIYPVAEVAIRYGFQTVARLKQWLLLNPGLVAEISKFRAAHQSDAGTKERATLKAQHAVENMIPAVSRLVTDPMVAGELRMKALDGLLHVGGFRGGAGAADKTAAAGATFNLTMQFAGGHEKVITATVIEPQTVPAIIDGAEIEDYEEDA